MFIDNEIEGYTDTNKNRQCITSGIKHWGLSCYSSILPRVKFSVTDRIVARNPQRFIPPTVGGHAKGRHRK
jgi:hypothetical protein